MTRIADSDRLKLKRWIDKIEAPVDDFATLREHSKSV